MPRIIESQRRNEPPKCETPIAESVGDLDTITSQDLTWALDAFARIPREEDNSGTDV